MTSRLPIAIGAVAGVVIGVLVGLATDIPLAPEAGLFLGAAAGWLYARKTS